MSLRPSTILRALPALTLVAGLLLPSPARAQEDRRPVVERRAAKRQVVEWQDEGRQREQPETRPVQVSLLSPVQIFPPETGITGVRLSLLYGRNAAMTGLDVGLTTHTTGDAAAFQWGAVHVMEGDFTGWQQGLINYDQGAFTGLGEGLVNYAVGEVKGIQFGGVNVAGSAFEGLQAGVYNQAATSRGLQIGIVNYTARAGSVFQLGLVNIISSKERLPVLPVVNWSF